MFISRFLETLAAHRRRVDDVFHALVRDIWGRGRETVQESEAKENGSQSDASRWRRLWSPKPQSSGRPGRGREGEEGEGNEGQGRPMRGSRRLD